MNLVTLRYNLVNTGLLSNRQALTFAAVGPVALSVLVQWLPLDFGEALDTLCSLAIGYWVPLLVYVVAMRQSPLALRDEVRKDVLRLSISAFRPVQGSLQEVQEVLRKWAKYAAHGDVQLRVLLRMDKPQDRQEFIARRIPRSESSFGTRSSSLTALSVFSRRSSCPSSIRSKTVLSLEGSDRAAVHRRLSCDHTRVLDHTRLLTTPVC
ncbi:putative transmembrane protein [Gregarina niphandrodes]|uniref:Transmembrane protein n=1 Tax=Gregarina niphandrodes TaxID=110365 RepID=A0A023BBD5_GRENI|nr:putative transmembrane protein [Gregarina niphandrodes]EZG79501.1 putative transmembrane protein [Gregarina niphandrodes]|eukprot:XP_011134425.1 putative transmembrane protein [Gregarina niphandrodes]